MTKTQAIEEIKRSPFQPILRPCSHTKDYPTLFAVTYWHKGHILHSLVERLLNGTYLEVHWDKKPVYGTMSYRSIHELENFVKGLMSDEDPS